MHVEDPVFPRDHLYSAENVLPLLENPRCQTGGVGPRPSGDAVLDPDVLALSHRLDSSMGRPACVGVPRETNPKDNLVSRGPTMQTDDPNDPGLRHST